MNGSHCTVAEAPTRPHPVRTCRRFMLAHVAGRGPVKLLLCISRVCMALQLLKVGGSFPVRSFLERSQVSRDVSVLQLLGRGPSKLLFAKSKVRRDFSTDKLSGRGPLRPLPRSCIAVTYPVGASQVMPGHGLLLLESSPHGCDSPVHSGSTPNGSAVRPAANLTSAWA